MYPNKYSDNRNYGTQIEHVQMKNTNYREYNPSQHVGSNTASLPFDNHSTYDTNPTSGDYCKPYNTYKINRESGSNVQTNSSNPIISHTNDTCKIRQSRENAHVASEGVNDNAFAPQTTPKMRSTRKLKEPDLYDGQRTEWPDYICHFEQVALWNQ